MIEIKPYTNYLVDHDVIMPYGKPLYRGDKITVISVDVENNKVKIMKIGDYDRGWFAYLSSFNRHFSKIDYENDYLKRKKERY